MVAPSKDLVHPFRENRSKRLEPNENDRSNTNQPTGKPGLVKKPFDNLFTGSNKAKIFDPLKHSNHKGARKVEQAETVSQNVHFYYLRLVNSTLLLMATLCIHARDG